MIEAPLAAKLGYFNACSSDDAPCARFDVDAVPSKARP